MAIDLGNSLIGLEATMKDFLIRTCMGFFVFLWTPIVVLGFAYETFCQFFVVGQLMANDLAKIIVKRIVKG